MPGSDLDGFAFDTSQAYTGMAEDSASFLSDGRSTFVDPNTLGLTTEALFPTLTAVPEPASLAVLSFALLLLRKPPLRRQARVAAAQNHKLPPY